MRLEKEINQIDSIKGIPISSVDNPNFDSYNEIDSEKNSESNDNIEEKDTLNKEKEPSKKKIRTLKNFNLQ